MRTIEWTSAFNRDYKRTKATPRHRNIEVLLPEIVSRLADDKPLEEKYRDHSLIGNWKGHRECHLKPDLLLIYKKPDDKTIRLVCAWAHTVSCLLNKA